MQTTNTRWQRSCGTAVLAMVAALILSLSSIATGQNPGTQASLLGTWVVEVQQQDCQSGAALGDPFRSLLTFDAGGTMTETTANPMFYPSERGPGHGVWHRTGDQSFQASSVALITLNGALTASQTITQTIQMGTDPNAFQTTKAQVRFFAPDGTLVRSGCASAAGVRFR